MSELLEFDRLPALAAQYGRSMFSFRKAAEKPELPRLEARVKAVTVDGAKLAAYRTVCGFGPGDVLPATYPQVLATPLHAALIGHAKFPFRALGLVHVSQKITQLRRIGQTEGLAISCDVEGLRQARQGFEFDLLTHVDAGGQRVWEGVTTVLARTGVKGPKEERRRERPPPGEPAGASKSVFWRVPEDQGRRYASVSGDWNPIHLTSISAKLFGFPRAIVHGMWSLARALAELEDPSAPDRLTVQCAFKRPVLLPSTVLFHAHPVLGGYEFALRTRDGGSAHLTGSVVAG